MEDYESLKKQAENQPPLQPGDIEKALAPLFNAQLLGNSIITDKLTAEQMRIKGEQLLANAKAAIQGEPIPYPEWLPKPPRERTEGEKIGEGLAHEFNEAVNALEEAYQGIIKEYPAEFQGDIARTFKNETESLRIFDE